MLCQQPLALIHFSCKRQQRYCSSHHHPFLPKDGTSGLAIGCNADKRPWHLRHVIRWESTRQSDVRLPLFNFTMHLLCWTCTPSFAHEEHRAMHDMTVQLRDWHALLQAPGWQWPQSRPVLKTGNQCPLCKQWQSIVHQMPSIISHGLMNGLGSDSKHQCPSRMADRLRLSPFLPAVRASWQPSLLRGCSCGGKCLSSQTVAMQMQQILCMWGAAHASLSSNVGGGHEHVTRCILLDMCLAMSWRLCLRSSVGHKAEPACDQQQA